MTGLYIRAGDSNSGLQAFTASVLPKSSPHFLNGEKVILTGLIMHVDFYIARLNMKHSIPFVLMVQIPRHPQLN